MGEGAGPNGECGAMVLKTGLWGEGAGLLGEGAWPMGGGGASARGVSMGCLWGSHEVSMGQLWGDYWAAMGSLWGS